MIQPSRPRPLALPAWVRPRHPIVWYERRHWDHSRGWRLARGLIWGGALVFILLPAACALLFNLTATFNNPGELILGLGGTFTIGLVVTSTLAVWFNNLSASFLGATLIARERESQSWPFLRLTSLSSLDILGGKLAALGYTLTRPVLLIVGLRVLTILSGLATLVLAALTSGITPQQAREILAAIVADLSLGVSDLVLLQLSLLGGGLLAGLLWLLEPVVGILYNAAVGVAASTLAKSRGTAVVLVVAAHFVLGLGIYAPAQQVGLLAMLPFMQAAMTINPLALTVFSTVLQTAITAVIWWSIVIGCLAFALWRVERLSE